MNEDQLRKAVALLRSFTDNLPKGDIEERYVNFYHSLLTDIETETENDFDYFMIDDSELKHRVTSTSFGQFGIGPAEHNYSKTRYCEREMFLMKLHGVLNYMRSFLPEPAKRIIGFTPAE